MLYIIYIEKNIKHCIVYVRLKLMPAVVSNAVKSVDAKRVAHIVADGR